MYYRIFDEVLASDVLLPQLDELSGTPTATIHLNEGSASDPEDALALVHEWDGLASYRTPSGYLLDFEEGLRADLQPSKGKIVCEKAQDLDEVRFQHLISDQVIPRLIGHLGGLVLHAAAVSLQGEVLVLVGESGVGKSTLSSWLVVEKSASLIGDDAIRIVTSGDRFNVFGSYPGLRVCEDSYEWIAAGRQGQHQPPVVAADKYKVKPMHIATDGELSRMCILEQAATTETVNIGASDVVNVLSQVFVLDPGDTEGAQRRMEVVDAMSRQGLLLGVKVEHDYARIPDLMQAIGV